MSEIVHEVKEKTKQKTTNTVWVRLQVTRQTHRKIKSFNLTQPRETIARSYEKVIEKGLESLTQQP